jgi:thiol peroxidase
VDDPAVIPVICWRKGTMAKNHIITTFLGLTAPMMVLFIGCKESIMKEQTSMVTMKGKPVTLVGKVVKVGQKAPDFEVVANDMSVVKFSSFAGKTCIIASVPSLDTSVCDMETRRFNEEADKLGENVVVLTISMDLPFAQKRWCGAAGVKNVQTLSDYRYASFGNAYGVLIKDLRLLARAVFIVDKAGVIRYVQIVPEIATEPDYDAAIKAVKELQGK